MLRAEQSAVRTLAEARDFSSPKRSDQLWCSSTLPYNGFQGSLRGWSCLGAKADHSPPSTAEVENEWSFISTLPPFLHGVYRDKFNFTFYALKGMPVGLRNRFAFFRDKSVVSAGNRTQFLWRPACILVIIPPGPSRLPPVNLCCTKIVSSWL